MKNNNYELLDGLYFFRHPAAPADSDIGSYYTEYNPATEEGKGWFGTRNEASYFVEYRLDEEGILRFRHCGKGRGCFWTDWE